MGVYIVTFKNNKAILSHKVDSDMFDPINIEHINNIDEIRSMTVFAKSEKKSIERANLIANNIVSILHSFS